MKKIAFLATSVDGYIARSDGSLDWLDKANTLVPKDFDGGFKDFLSNTDAIVMGRKTYEQVVSFGVWPYEKTPVWVLSQNKKMTLSKDHEGKAFLIKESIQSLCERWEKKGAKQIYIDGGQTIRSFLAEGLLDELIITTVPVALGSGLHLFQGIKKDVELKLIKNQSYDFGYVQMHYSVMK